MRSMRTLMEGFKRGLKENSINLNDLAIGDTITYVVPGTSNKTAKGKVIDLKSNTTENFAVIMTNGKKQHIQYSHIGGINESKEEYKLDQTLIDKLKDPFITTWQKIGSDAIATGVKKNDGAIEIVLDANALARFGHEEADKIVHDLAMNYGFDELVKFLSGNIILL